MDFDPEKVTSRRVGRALGKMRLKNDRTGKSRQWTISLADLVRWFGAYGIPLPNGVSDVVNAPNDVNDVNDVSDVNMEREVIEV